MTDLVVPAVTFRGDVPTCMATHRSVSFLVRQMRSVAWAFGGVRPIVVAYGLIQSDLPEGVLLVHCDPPGRLGLAGMIKLGLEQCGPGHSVVAYEDVPLTRKQAASLCSTAVLASTRKKTSGPYVGTKEFIGYLSGIGYGAGRPWGRAFSLDVAFRDFYVGAAGPTLMGHEPIADYVSSGGTVRIA